MNELQHVEQTIERLTRAAWYETGLQYARIRDENLFKQGDWITWNNYCADRWNREASGVDNQILMAKQSAEMAKILGISETILPSAMSHATELSKLKDADERAVVWQRVTNSANGSGVTAIMVRGEIERYKAEKSKDWYTLDEWQALSGEDQQRLIEQAYSNNKTFNETNDNVEWALWTWNPVTGCLHDCPYCYARDIAARFFPQNFVPSFLPSRLTAPANTKNPKLEHEKDPVRRLGLQNVFVCSMADLFGKWVPAEWIHSVLKQAWDNPQWTFLFLTKFPIRMAEFDFPPNSWIGTTVDKQWSVERAEKAFRKIRAGGYEGVAWLSCEPMLERLTFTSLDMFDWVVMGGSSKSTQTPESRPDFEWVNHLYNQAKAINLPVYMKTNLGIEQRERDYPV